MFRFTSPTVAGYIDRLRKQTEPTRNDRRLAAYVRYINGFLGYFGRERYMLAGSTAEQSKLRWSKHGGDADFILISGKVEVPVECLEFREDMPCFVWIHGERFHSALNVKLVEGTYLPTGVLRVVGPEAFTMLRGLYKMITSSSDGVLGTHTRVTTLGVASKVGLARTEFSGLKMSENEERKLMTQLNNFEYECAPDEGENGPWNAFKTNVSVSKKQQLKQLSAEPKVFKVEYEQQNGKDFVPAFRVTGRLEYMDDWRKRSRVWPSVAAVDDIYNSEVYVVSKFAPVNANITNDFCLSFNRAELKLSECLSPVQRDAFLILKSYLKGTISKYSDKLTTFHLKTALYLVSETADPEIWREDRIMEAVSLLLQFIRDALVGKRMRHFFVPSNLFAGLDGHFVVLLEAIDYILANPLDCIAAFFDLDDGLPATTYLDEDQLHCLARVYKDGGKQESADIIEDALNDIRRGFDEGPKDANGEAPIQAAFTHVARMYLAEEGKTRLNKEVTRWNLAGSLGQSVIDIANGFISQIDTCDGHISARGSRQTPCTSSDGGVDRGDSDILGAAMSLMTGDTRREDSCEADVLGTFCQYLTTSHSDRRERQRLENKLLSKGICYFFGKDYGLLKHCHGGCVLDQFTNCADPDQASRSDPGMQSFLSLCVRHSK